MEGKSWRATIRAGWGYRVVDVAGETLRDALVQLVERYPAEAADADLVEVRRQAEPETRVYTPE